MADSFSKQSFLADDTRLQFLGVSSSKHCKESLNALMYEYSFDDFWALREYINYLNSLDYANHLQQKEEMSNGR